MTVQRACRCFEQVTCKAVTIRNLNTANELVDTAIAAAMQEKKPVLIQVCSPLTCVSACNALCLSSYDSCAQTRGVLHSAMSTPQIYVEHPRSMTARGYTDRGCMHACAMPSSCCTNP